MVTKFFSSFVSYKNVSVLSCVRFLNGLVSGGGKGCAEDGYPGFYTRISYYLPWIKSKIEAYV